MVLSTNTVRVPASVAMSGVVMNVKLTGLRVFRVRVWLAARLIRLAAIVAGCGIEIEK